MVKNESDDFTTIRVTRTTKAEFDLALLLTAAEIQQSLTQNDFLRVLLKVLKGKTLDNIRGDIAGGETLDNALAAESA